MPPQPPKKLQEILQRAADGDQQAWREIVEAFHARVFGLIRAHSGSVDLAEEVTQSTFCSMAQHIGRYAEVGRFEAWLFRIAMNRLRDEMRRRRRQANPVDPQTLTGLQDKPTRSESGAETTEEARALQGAMERLSEADRQVIHLRHFAGLSF